jgi:hypothetical protein
MKITKKKEVVTEEIEVSPGEYYFVDANAVFYKMVLEEDEDAIYYFYEKVENFSDVWGIRVKKDSIIFGEEELPYAFSAFIRGISGIKIEKEEFEQQKQEVIKRLL